jgi:hypothetical protein
MRIIFFLLSLFFVDSSVADSSAANCVFLDEDKKIVQAPIKFIGLRPSNGICIRWYEGRAWSLNFIDWVKNVGKEGHAKEYKDSIYNPFAHHEFELARLQLKNDLSDNRFVVNRLYEQIDELAKLYQVAGDDSWRDAELKEALGYVGISLYRNFEALRYIQIGSDEKINAAQRFIFTRLMFYGLSDQIRLNTMGGVYAHFLKARHFNFNTKDLFTLAQGISQFAETKYGEFDISEGKLVKRKSPDPSMYLSLNIVATNIYAFCFLAGTAAPKSEIDSSGWYKFACGQNAINYSEKWNLRNILIDVLEEMNKEAQSKGHSDIQKNTAVKILDYKIEVAVKEGKVFKALEFSILKFYFQNREYFYPSALFLIFVAIISVGIAKRDKEKFFLLGCLICIWQFLKKMVTFQESRLGGLEKWVLMFITFLGAFLFQEMFSDSISLFQRL